MIELSPEIITILMLGGVVVGVLTGYPLALIVGAVALVVGYTVFGGTVFYLLYERLFSIIHSYTILAVPLFLFMGLMLGYSGIAEKMYSTLYLWIGGFRGGLAIITVLIGTILAACVGIVGASVTMLGIVALPSMIKRGYDRSLAAGSVCAGGTLGNFIPPSILLVIYGPMAMLSVGKLFMGAIVPGFILSSLYCSYIALRCLFQPKMAPVVPPDERAVPFIKKTTMLVTSLAPPGFLILAVLGSIFLGVAPPTEAAAVGAFAATLLAVIYRKFNWQCLKDVTLQTLRVTAMVMLIGGLSFAFTGVFLGSGGGNVVEDLILSAPAGRWGSFALVMFTMFILGFFIDALGIIFIMVPIVSPIAPLLHFDPLWFGVLIVMNCQMAYMTPPFAVSIFYLKGVITPELGVTIGDIIRGIFPFVALVMIGIGLCAAFPELVLWLPGMMIK